nr:hypothetical protein [uncultured Rhodopila sp.]
MQQSPIQIGMINLQDFEVPPSVRFGGRYRVMSHTLSGGTRILERLGPDDGDIQFRGTFSGPQAEARMRAINNLRLTGEVVWLTWESFRYQVIVKSFVADYHSPWWISYQIGCLVARQDGAADPQDQALSALVTADLAQAIAAVSGSSIQLGSLQTALSAPYALSAGTSDQSQVIAAVASSQAAIDQQITARSAVLATPFGTASAVSGYGSGLQSTVAAAGGLAAAVNANAYVGRIGSRLRASGV